MSIVDVVAIWLGWSYIELPVLVRSEQVFPNLRQHLQRHFIREWRMDTHSETHTVF